MRSRSHRLPSSRPARGLSLAVAIACVSGACLAQGPASGRSAAPAEDPEARYQRQRALCESGLSPQDRQTCLREAGAALEAARRGQLSNEVDEQRYRQNAMARCKPLPPEDRKACEARMSGQGVTRGSVESGGIYRELRIREVAPREGTAPQPAPMPSQTAPAVPPQTAPVRPPGGTLAAPPPPASREPLPPGGTVPPRQTLPAPGVVPPPGAIPPRGTAVPSAPPDRPPLPGVAPREPVPGDRTPPPATAPQPVTPREPLPSESVPREVPPPEIAPRAPGTSQPVPRDPARPQPLPLPGGSGSTGGSVR